MNTFFGGKSTLIGIGKQNRNLIQLKAFSRQNNLSKYSKHVMKENGFIILISCVKASISKLVN